MTIAHLWYRYPGLLFLALGLWALWKAIVTDSGTNMAHWDACSFHQCLISEQPISDMDCAICSGFNDHIILQKGPNPGCIVTTDIKNE